MRYFTVDTVVVTHDAAALVAPKVLERARQEGLVVIVANPQDLVAEEIADQIIGIGFSANDVQLHHHVDIYFHVGDVVDLYRKFGVTVPLTGQGGAGVRNVIRWALATRSTPQPLASHLDVAHHAERSAQEYRDAGYVARMEHTSREAAADLMTAFPAIQVVLGTGFPFYCMSHIDQPDRSPTPVSIQYYTATQADFFNQKLVPESMQFEYATISRRVFTPDQLFKLGLNPGQTAFNAYEYRRWGLEAPVTPPKGTLSEFIEANVLELKERDWPCHLCTTLHDVSRYPEQAWERDFMASCLQCRQTSFIPRAVGVLRSDIDLVALTAAHQDPTQLAQEIAHWIDVHPQYFRHDTRWHEELEGDQYPLDVYVSTVDEFLTAADQIADAEDWISVKAEVTVTWLPVTHRSYSLGKYLPLCMELLRDKTTGPAGFSHRFDQARHRFATRVTADQVLDAYARNSEYLRQLASNLSVAKTLRSRLALWRGEPWRQEVWS